MRVEGRDLVHLGEGQLHLLGEGCEMGRRQMVVAVLNEVEMFDEKIPATRPVTEQFPNLGEHPGIDLAAFRMKGRVPAPPARVTMFPRSRGGCFLHLATHSQLEAEEDCGRSLQRGKRRSNRVGRNHNYHKGLLVTLPSPLT